MILKKGNGALLVGISLALGVAGGFWLAHQRISGLPNTTQEQSLNSPGERKALYWYDPMYPQQKFDKPGKSPFMDMQLVPQYAGGAGDRATVSIDPSLTQNLGLRFTTVTRGIFDSSLDVTGVLGFNERDVAVIQARTTGFVERVYAHAPGDVLKTNEALADILVPEWAAAQSEFLALKTLLVQRHRNGRPTFGVEIAIGNALKSLGLPCSTAHVLDNPLPDFHEVAESLSREFERTTTKRRYLCPLDLADDIPELQFGNRAGAHRLQLFANNRDRSFIIGDLDAGLHG